MEGGEKEVDNQSIGVCSVSCAIESSGVGLSVLLPKGLYVNWPLEGRFQVYLYLSESARRCGVAEA